MFNFYNLNSNIIAEVADKNLLINEVQDILDLMADLGPQGCSSMIIHENNLSSDFFNLKTKLAGEILQKFSNYHFKLAIIGDFSKYTSKSLADFIRESNRGNRVWFVNDLQEALEKF